MAFAFGRHQCSRPDHWNRVCRSKAVRGGYLYKAAPRTSAARVRNRARFTRFFRLLSAYSRGGNGFFKVNRRRQPILPFSAETGQTEHIRTLLRRFTPERTFSPVLQWGPCLNATPGLPFE